MQTVFNFLNMCPLHVLQGHVILAESQPLTDRQIQHTLWTETMDLSFTAGNMQDLHSDLEMEPSSPTRLLRNIERQVNLKPQAYRQKHRKDKIKMTDNNVICSFKTD